MGKYSLIHFYKRAWTITVSTIMSYISTSSLFAVVICVVSSVAAQGVPPPIPPPMTPPSPPMDPMMMMLLLSGGSDGDMSNMMLTMMTGYYVELWQTSLMSISKLQQITSQVPM